MLILGIETSCDETAASIIEVSGKGKIKILSDIVSSQAKLHAPFGGVVPNLAAREHTKNILTVLEEAFSMAKISPKEIDLISVTQGPGLIPALLVGMSAAKSLAFSLQKPLVGIHHIEGHIYANLIEKDSVEFPLICLVVSGGHTQLVLMKDHLNYEIIGETQDDAAGEAFDKVARILGLAYPGGPIISERAAKFKNEKKISLPRPMMNSKDFNFSFSGLKTAVLYETQKNQSLLKDENYTNEMCHEFQQSVIDVLINKTLSAAKKYGAKEIILAGGVSANQELKKQLKELLKGNAPQIKIDLLNQKFSTDNAVMIAAAAYYRSQKDKNFSNVKDDWSKMEANANLKLC